MVCLNAIYFFRYLCLITNVCACVHKYGAAVLSECFSLHHQCHTFSGCSPYPDVEIQALEPFVKYLKDGNRPLQPRGCPTHM